MTKIKLRSQLLLVHPESQQQEEEKVGSIFIPTTAKSRSKQAWGLVVDTGTGSSDYPMEVKKGDRVCYDNKRDYITIDGDILLKQSDIWFIDAVQ